MASTVVILIKNYEIPIRASWPTFNRFFWRWCTQSIAITLDAVTSVRLVTSSVVICKNGALSAIFFCLQVTRCRPVSWIAKIFPNIYVYGVYIGGLRVATFCRIVRKKSIPHMDTEKINKIIVLSFQVEIHVGLSFSVFFWIWLLPGLRATCFFFIQPNLNEKSAE